MKKYFYVLPFVLACLCIPFLASCSDDDDEDTHVHFHCEKCHRTYCLDEIAIPPVSLPEGYEGRSASYIVTGTCPACSSNAKSSGGTR